MKILVRAKPNARQEKVERIDQATLFAEDSQASLPTYKVSVTAQPVAGKANHAILKALSKYFGVSVSKISLLKGDSSKQKIFNIDV